MKTKISRIGKRSLSLVLTMMLVVSMMFVGMVAVNAVGASNGVISKGDILYFDVNSVKSGGINYLKPNGDKQLDYMSASNIPSDGILKLTLTGSYNFTDLKNSSQQIFKAESTGWQPIICNSVPSNGQNMIIISADGKSYTWGTYSATVTTYKVTYGSSNSTYGSVSAKTSSGTSVSSGSSVNSGTSVTFTATTSNNGVFGGWYSNSSCTTQLADSSSLTYTKSISSNTTVYAKFTAPVAYTITKTTPTNGTFDVSATSATSGTKVTVNNISPASGYEFDSISVSGGVTLTTVTEGSEYSFTMPTSNVTVTVTFKQSSTPAVPYNITVSNTDTNGTVSCDTSSATAGTTVNFTVTPKSGFAIDTVTVTGTTATKGTTTDGTTTYSFVMPEQDVTISATFKEIIEVSSAWSLVGDFNNWTATENPMHENSGVYSTTLYLPANSTGFEFKILDNESTEEHKHYSKVDGTFTDTISNQTLDNSASVDSDYNIVFKTTGGVYTFEWTASTKKLTVTKATTYTLTTSGTIPDSVGAGEDLNMTINTASTGTVPTISYYKYTVKAGNVNVVNGVKNENTSYNCKTTLSANTTITYYVKAYNADGELLGLTATGSQNVTVTVGDFTVDLRVDQTELVKGENATLSVNVTPSDYAGRYEYFHSTDGVEYKSIGTSTSASKKITPSDIGTNYYKVKVTSKYDDSEVVSYTIEVDVYESASSENEVTIYFKSASSFIYAPTISCNGATATAMTKDKFIGNAYSGSLKFYWYKTTITFDSTKNNTITFKTGRTQVNASYTARFLGKEYYFAVDNLMADRTVYNLTSAAEYIRNFYHSPLNMVTMGDISDGNLGFTNIGGTTYKMGSYLTAQADTTGATTINASFSVKSATAAQKVSAELEEVSDTQYGLLDVNLDGVVDVRDATLMQKALLYA